MCECGAVCGVAGLGTVGGVGVGVVGWWGGGGGKGGCPGCCICMFTTRISLGSRGHIVGKGVHREANHRTRIITHFLMFCFVLFSLVWCKFYRQ